MNSARAIDRNQGSPVADYEIERGLIQYNETRKDRKSFSAPVLRKGVLHERFVFLGPQGRTNSQPGVERNRRQAYFAQPWVAGGLTSSPAKGDLAISIAEAFYAYEAAQGEYYQGTRTCGRAKHPNITEEAHLDEAPRDIGGRCRLRVGLFVNGSAAIIPARGSVGAKHL